MNNLVIRKSKNMDLVLYRNREGVYFLSKFGQVIDNGLDYDKISDKFNKENRKNV